MDQDLEQTRYWRTLRRKITNHFSLGELKVLCHDVMVDYDELAGEEKIEKASNLIGYLARRGRLADLVVVLKEERPKVDWEESIPSPDKQVQDAEKLLPPAKDDLILRKYFERLEQYLPSVSLEHAKDDKQLQETIHVLTKTYMEQLDLFRRTRLVRHIGENNLQLVISLRGIDLSGADLSGINLQGANLVSALFVKTFLENANLAGTNLSGAQMNQAFLNNADLRGANLANAKLNNASLVQSNLQEANFSNANLSKARMHKANLRGANLTDVLIEDVDFTGADLRDAKCDGWRTMYDEIQSYRRSNFPNLDGALLNTNALLLERTDALLHRGAFEDALRDAVELCNLENATKWDHFLRGLAFMGLKREDMARSAFEKAWSLPEGVEITEYLYDISKQSVFISLQPDGNLETSKVEKNNPHSELIGLKLLFTIFPDNEKVIQCKEKIKQSRPKGYTRRHERSDSVFVETQKGD